MNIFSKLSLVMGIASKFSTTQMTMFGLVSTALFQAKKALLVLQGAVDKGRFAAQFAQAKRGFSLILSGVADIAEAGRSVYKEVEHSSENEDIRRAFLPVFGTLSSLKDSIEPLTDMAKGFAEDFKALEPEKSISWLSRDEGFRRITSLGCVEVSKEEFENWAGVAQQEDEYDTLCEDKLETLGYARYFQATNGVVRTKIYWATKE